MRRDRTELSTCRTNGQLKDLPAAGSQITRVITLIACCGLVFASCGFGALFAWQTGLHHGQVMAALFVVFAVSLEICKPLALAAAFQAFRSWAVMRGFALLALAGVAVAYSLTAELTLMATARGDLVANRAADTKSAKSVDGQRTRIETELAKLASSRPAATVRAEIAGALADPRVGECRSLA